jgi:hypothetical protein
VAAGRPGVDGVRAAPRRSDELDLRLDAQRVVAARGLRSVTEL